VRVVEIGNELTFLVVHVHYELGLRIRLGVDEKVVRSLPCADQSVDFQLLHTPVGASAQLPTSHSDIGQDARAKFMKVLHRWMDYLPPCHFDSLADLTATERLELRLIHFSETDFV